MTGTNNQVSQTDNNQTPTTANEQIAADLEVKLVQVRQQFAERFSISTMRESNISMTFLDYNNVLSLVYKLKTVDEQIAAEGQDRALLALLVDMYASLIMGMDKRMEIKLISLGDMLPDVLREYIDSGFAVVYRYFLYYDGNGVVNLPAAKKPVTRSLFLKCLSVAIIIFIAFAFWKVRVPNIRFMGIGLTSIVRLGMALLVMICAYTFAYSSSAGFTIRNWFRKPLEPNYAQQVKAEYNAVNDLHNSIVGAREEIIFQIMDLITKSQNLQLKSYYGTYLTLSELKTVLIKDDTLSVRQRYVLLILLGYKPLRAFFNDFTFMYWTVSSTFRQYGWVIAASLISFYWTYASLVAGFASLPGLGIVLGVNKILGLFDSFMG